MTNLKAKFVIPALLAGSALVSGCDAKNAHEDLRGMTDAIAAACPTYNKTTEDKANCAKVGKIQALKLFEYSEIGDQFKKSCTFRELPKNIPEMAVPMISGTEASRCLSVIEGVAKDPVVKKTAGEINKTLRAGIL
jgi:hypothetical protein